MDGKGVEGIFRRVGGGVREGGADGQCEFLGL